MAIVYQAMGFVSINTGTWITVPPAIGDPINEQQGVTPRSLVQVGVAGFASGEIV